MSSIKNRFARRRARRGHGADSTGDNNAAAEAALPPQEGGPASPHQTTTDTVEGSSSATPGEDTEPSNAMVLYQPSQSPELNQQIVLADAADASAVAVAPVQPKTKSKSRKRAFVRNMKVGARLALSVAERASDACPPLKSAVGGVSAIVDIAQVCVLDFISSARF